MTRKTLPLRYVVPVILIGIAILWYDFHLFVYLTPTLVDAFFPEDPFYATLFFQVVILAFNGVTRLLGAFVLGFEGDKKGRRFALIVSMGVMSFSALGLALTPTYATIGWLAPLLFFLFRGMQSFALGGEFTGGMLYLVEFAPPKKRSFYGSFSFFGLSLGVLFSSFNLYFFGNQFGEVDFLNWGWRLLYFFGGLVGLLLFYLRTRFHETHLFQESRRALRGEKNPIYELARHHKISFFKAFGIGILEVVGFNLLIAYLVSFWGHEYGMPLELATRINLPGLLIFPIAILILGKLTETFHVKRQAIISAFFVFLFSVPIFYWMGTNGDLEKSIGVALLLCLLAGYMVSLPGIYCELFPTRVRFIGMSVGYNLAVVLFGESTPEFVHTLGNWISEPFNAGFYLTLAAATSLLVLIKIKNKVLFVP